MKLQSSELNLTLSDKIGTFELKSRRFPGCWLRSQFEVVCRFQDKKISLLSTPFAILDFNDEHIVETRFSKFNALSLTLNSNVSGVSVILKIGLSARAAANIQISIINNTDKNLILDRITPLHIQSGDLHLGESEIQEPAFYSNGWQSWSHSGAYLLGDKQRTSKLGFIQNPAIINPHTPRPKKPNHFTSEMFGVLGDRSTQVGVLGGFVSQKNHFSSLEAKFYPQPSLKMWANGDNATINPGEGFTTDWAVMSFIDLKAANPLQGYFKTVAQEHEIQSCQPVPVGWCSWYHFYEDIKQEDIEANLESIKALKPEITLSLLQIDDGYETHPGDWADFDPGFPNGLKPLARKINASGLTPGLWLAPYILHPRADLVKQHPDWLLRNKWGRPVNAGFGWNTFNYALDLTNREALAYTCEVVRRAVEDWGFEYLKLDFLYAAALDGIYQDPTRTRAQVLRRGLEALREAVGPAVTLLACGCPLGSALGIFEAMRISADVSGSWKPHFPPFSPLLRKEPHLPAARNALQNILSRAMMHRHWWINDPDCLLLRPDTNLSMAEAQTLGTAISLTGGSLLLSDNLPDLPRERLKIAQALLPVIDQRAQVIDWIDSETPSRLRVDLEGAVGTWHLLALFNWDDKPQSLTFSPQAFRLSEDGIWWLREFWSGVVGKMGADSSYTFYKVPPHTVRTVAVRTYDADQPTYLGGDIHLSQGLEISEWKTDESSLSLRFDLGRKASGVLSFYLPFKPSGVWFRNKSHMVQDMGQSVYKVNLEDLDGQEMKIRG